DIQLRVVLENRNLVAASNNLEQLPPNFRNDIAERLVQFVVAASEFQQQCYCYGSVFNGDSDIFLADSVLVDGEILAPNGRHERTVVVLHCKVEGYGAICGRELIRTLLARLIPA